MEKKKTKTDYLYRTEQVFFTISTSIYSNLYQHQFGPQLQFSNPNPSMQNICTCRFKHTALNTMDLILHVTPSIFQQESMLIRLPLIVCVHCKNGQHFIDGWSNKLLIPLTSFHSHFIIKLILLHPTKIEIIFIFIRSIKIAHFYFW